MGGRREGGNPGAGAGRTDALASKAGRSSGQRALILALLGLGAAAGLGASYWYMKGRPPAAPAIVVGDGKSGPAGMARVPGGEFLMGSDSKMAQPNEKPAHKVRVHASWM